jgi:hypothetical protein
MVSDYRLDARVAERQLRTRSTVVGYSVSDVRDICNPAAASHRFVTLNLKPTLTLNRTFYFIRLDLVPKTA